MKHTKKITAVVLSLMLLLVCFAPLYALADDACPHQWIWVIDRQPNCGVQGLEHEYCTKCGDTRNEGTPIATVGSHNFAWKVDEEATCCTRGLKHRECTVCGTWETPDEYTAIPRTNAHTWVWEDSAEHNAQLNAINGANYRYQAPTCGAQGVTYQYCSVCFSKNIATVQSENTLVAPTATAQNDTHTWEPVNNDSRNKAPTCTRDGCQVYVCSVCHNEKAQVIDKAPHADNDGDGYCDACGTKLTSSGISLKTVLDRIVAFFTNIYSRIASLFGNISFGN